VPAGLITAARAVNRSMPNHVAGVIHDLLYQAGVPAGEGRVLLLGWSYKPEVGDPRETPAEPLAEALLAKNVHVASWDPHLDGAEIPESVEFISDLSHVENFDLAVLVTAHEACLNLDWSSLLGRMRHNLLYDGRRVLDLEALSSIGWQVHAVGRPSIV